MENAQALIVLLFQFLCRRYTFSKWKVAKPSKTTKTILTAVYAGRKYIKQKVLTEFLLLLSVRRGGGEDMKTLELL